MKADRQYNVDTFYLSYGKLKKLTCIIFRIMKRKYEEVLQGSPFVLRRSMIRGKLRF